MIRLSKEQKKIIYIGLILAAALLLFVFFIYAPQQRKLRQIRDELNRAEGQIQEVHQLTAGRELTEAVRDLNIQLKNISQKMLAQEDSLINNLNSQAKALRIDIRDLDPGDKILLPNKAIGYDVYELAVAMNITGEYRELGEYLGNLEGDFPALLRINKIDINGKGMGNVNLSARLGLSAYLLKEQ